MYSCTHVFYDNDHKNKLHSLLAIYKHYTLKNAGLNTTQRWVKYGPGDWITGQKVGLNI